jgi:predicted deacylase
MNDISNYNFSGRRPGRHLLVLGAIHGNETCGALAIERLVADLNLQKIVLEAGGLTLIPVCNPQAYKQKTRYIEENLNRVFTKYPNPNSYEQKCANQLTNFFDKAEYILDLHSQHVDGAPYCFAQNNSRKLIDFVQALGVENIIFDWSELYPEGDFTTESYAESLGKIGTTVECGRHTNPKTVQIAYDTILRAMLHLGMVSPGCISKPTSQTRNLHMLKRYDYQSGGKLSRAWQHLEYLPKGTVLATLTNGGEIKAPENSYMILPKLTNNKPGEEWFYLAATKHRAKVAFAAK